jgi:hypothetical protein
VKGKAALIALGIMFIMMPIAATVSDAGTVYPSIFSSTVSYGTVYVNENFSIYVNSTYGFNNYTVVLIFSGLNLSGMAPGTTVLSQNQPNPDLVFNITAPSNPGTISILVMTSAHGSTIMQYRTTVQLTVVNPIKMQATISNPTQYYMYNVTVTFAINGNNVSKIVIPKLAPYSSQIVSTYSSAVSVINKGENTISVYASTPGAVVSGDSTFYYGTPSNYTWIYYIAAVVVAFMIFLAVSAGRRSIPKSPKWKK